MPNLSSSTRTYHPIGDYLAQSNYSRMTNNAIRRLGIVDLHSHFRLRPLLNFFRVQTGKTAAEVLELGCGNGVNLFELSRILSVRAVGYDMDAAAIEEARRVSSAYFGSAITFRCQDVFSVEEHSSFDYALCMDVLEHVEEPQTLLLKVDRLLKHGGHLVISVPTERYPKVFGLRFHRAIGHVMDGYNLRLLDRTVPAGYERVTCSYSTGLLASLGCILYYRVALTLPIHQLSVATCILLISLFKWFDILNDERFSCSLFAVYRKA